MNDFFDRLSNAARHAAGTVAGEVSIAAEKQKLNDAYRALGRLCYDAMKADKSLVCDDQIARIDGILARIDELKSRRSAAPEAAPTPAPTPAEEPITADETDFVIVEE